MKQFRHNVVRWLRRFLGRPAFAPRELRRVEQAVPAEWFVERSGRDTERAFAVHGMDGHEWEEFEE